MNLRYFLFIVLCVGVLGFYFTFILFYYKFMGEFVRWLFLFVEYLV